MQNRGSIKLNYIYRFFCWCSGARLYLLKQCPTDFNKFFGIGIIVVFTGIMAAISGGYALYTIFENLVFSLIFGALWGLLIFSLDWYILASLKKEKKFFKEFLNTLPRILLAVLLGIIISKPLELKLFENEIKQEIISIQKDLNLNYRNKVFNEFNEVDILTEENKRLSTEIKQKESYRDSLFNLIIEEAEGRSPTGIIGKGPVYREKKQEFDRINNELTLLKEHNMGIIEQNELRINSIRENREEEIKKGTETSKNYDGFLAQMQALNSLSQKNKHIKYVNFFVILLFVIIEASPMLVKLMASRGAYDVLFEFEEQKNTSEVKKQIAEIELENFQRIETELENEIQKARVKSSIYKQKLKEIKKAKNQINKSKIEKWKNSKEESIKNQENNISEEELFSD